MRGTALRPFAAATTEAASKRFSHGQGSSAQDLSFKASPVAVPLAGGLRRNFEDLDTFPVRSGFTGSQVVSKEAAQEILDVFVNDSENSSYRMSCSPPTRTHNPVVHDSLFLRSRSFDTASPAPPRASFVCRGFTTPQACPVVPMSVTMAASNESIPEDETCESSEMCNTEPHYSILS